MKKYVLIILVMIFGFQLNAQSNWKIFWKQSTPLKVWIITHPFKAKKAQLISEETKKVTDSIAKINLLDGDKFGGQVDAFRHAYWMARLHQKIGKCAALSLGKAYERSNKKSLKKSKRKNKVSGYDKPSKEMDLFNNKIGVTFTKKKQTLSKQKLINQIIISIKKGDLKILKKNKYGNFLDCNGVVLESKIPKWKTKKCLIHSNKNALN
ncbi:hypothetical protein R3X25_05685 [Lutibacter sp. TH_r2]|uniref:DUF6973 domain-containing protein n=1 Tax=Lutibacter sp. TH_r2 TaxID=3082083 RepID=UPI0029556F14|nr:hypothetical protein [Lutibacter sp. TH_r2]MDV7186767.1 hypothetical protein [Lutibacter sp. TH_r2]